MENKVRNTHIDSLRGLAVILMVMVHAAATWNPYQSTQTTLIAYIVAGLGGLAAPLFVTIFGWGLINSQSIFRSNAIKALMLIILQIIVNLTSPHLYDTFSPGILSLFAMLILLKPLIIYCSKTPRNFIITILIIFSTLVVSMNFENLQGVNDWDYRVAVASNFDFVKHLILTGTYPLFPWITFAIIGAFLGSTGKEGNDVPPRNNTVFLLIIIGLIYCIITLSLSISKNVIWAHPTKGDYLNFFPANLGFMIASITGVMILGLIINQFNIIIFQNAGKLSLTIYVIHFIPLSLMSNYEVYYSWNAVEASLVVAIYATTWLIFAFIWKRYQWLTIDNLIRRLSKV